MEKKRAVILEQNRDKRLQLAAALKGPMLGLLMLDNEADLFADFEQAVADLYVVRAEMDKVSGYSVCNRLRSHERAKDAKIVIVATQLDDPRLAAHKSSGQPADAYISPPLGLKDLRLQAYSLLDLDGGTLSDEDIQAVEEDPLSKLDEVLSGEGSATSGLSAQASSEDPAPAPERRRAEFTDEDVDDAFGALDGTAKPARVEEVTEVMEDNEILDSTDVLEVPEAKPAQPSPLAGLSAEDLNFVESAFQRAPKPGAAPPLPPGVKSAKDVRGPEGKILQLREALREREQELQRLQEIWQTQEQAYKASGQRVAEMEVEVKAAQMELTALQKKLKEKEDEIKRVRKESGASTDHLIEEKVMLEKDLIEVVAGKEKVVAELRRVMGARERDLENTTKNLEATRTELEALRASSTQAMSELRTQTDRALELQREHHAKEKTELSDAAAAREQALSAEMAKSVQEWTDKHGATEKARAALEQELTDTKIVLESTEAERGRLTEELARKQQSLDEAYAQIAAESERFREEHEAKTAVEEQLKTRDTELAEAKAELERRDGKIKGLEEDLGSAKNDKEGLSQRLSERLAQKDEAITQKDTVIEQLTKELQVSREEREALVARLGERLTERETTIAEQKKQLEALQLDKVQVDTTVTQLQQRLSEAGEERERERQRLQSESEAASLRLVELQTQASEKLAAQMLEMEQLRQALKAEQAKVTPVLPPQLAGSPGAPSVSPQLAGSPGAPSAPSTEPSTAQTAAADTAVKSAGPDVLEDVSKKLGGLTEQ